MTPNNGPTVWCRITSRYSVKQHKFPISKESREAVVLTLLYGTVVLLYY